MDQVFCSEPQLVHDEKWVLEEIEQELATISRHCPRGEKTFDRLLQLLGELVVSLSRAADARSGSTVPDTDETDRLTQLVQRLEHDAEESKRQIRQLREQVHEAEEENLKLLADKSEWDRLIKSQRRQIETLQNQNNEQSETTVTQYTHINVSFTCSFSDDSHSADREIGVGAE